VVSLAATFMTFPLSLFYFHQFPNLFLITNLIAIPASTLIIYNGILVLAFSFFPSLSLLLAKSLTGIIWFLNFSVKMIEAQPFSVVRGIYINLFELILVFCVIVSFALLLLIKKKGYFYFSTGMAVLLLISISIRHYSNLTQQKIVIYNINKATAIDFMDGKKGILLADTALLRDESKMGYHIQNNRIRSGLKIMDGLVPIDLSYRYDHLFKQGNFIQFYNNTLLLIDNNLKFYPIQTIPRIDYLILSHDAAITISELAASFDFRLIIMDSSNSFWKTKQWIEECRQLKINFYSTRNGGAWVSQI
jgi:competence protein ComEC